MANPEILIERLVFAGSPWWRVEVRRDEEPPAVALTEPLTDAALAALPTAPGAPAWTRTWGGFRRALPELDPGTIQAVGRLIYDRMLGVSPIGERLREILTDRDQHRLGLRIALLVLDGGDPVLAHLPFELAHDGAGFVFKRTTLPLVRCGPYEQFLSIEPHRGACALVVVAIPAAERERCAGRIEAVLSAAQRARYVPELLVDPTPEALRKRLLLQGPAPRFVHVVCPAIEVPGRLPRLVLHEGSLPAEELGDWLYEAGELGRTPTLFALLATAEGADGGGGTGTAAAWLARSMRAALAAGTAAPVRAEYALYWSERSFRALEPGGHFEHMLAEMCREQAQIGPAWPVIQLHGRRYEREPYPGQCAWPARLRLIRVEMRPPHLWPGAPPAFGGPPASPFGPPPPAPGFGPPSPSFGHVPQPEDPRCSNVAYTALDVQQLEPREAMFFLSQTAWGQDAPAPASARAVGELIHHDLGGVPLAVHLAGCVLRDGLSARDYLTALRAARGADPLSRALHVTYSSLDMQASWALRAMSLLPRGNGPDRQLAAILEWPISFASAVIDRLCRRGLVERTLSWSCSVHEAIAALVRSWVKEQPETWDRLHLGVARSAVALARWGKEPVTVPSPGDANERRHAAGDDWLLPGPPPPPGPKRWILLDDFFRFLDQGPWKAGAPGIELLQEAIRIHASAPTAR